MSTRQPSHGAHRIISKLVVNVIDWGELYIHRNQADVSFDASAGPLGVVQPDGSMVFDESVGRAFERAAEPHPLSSAEVAEFRQAIRAVTFTALNKRVEGYEQEDGRFEGREMLLDADNEADQFVNVGLREAHWATNGQRICYRLSPDLGSRLMDAQDGPGQDVARNAAMALADQYAQARGDWPDNAVQGLLKTPRDEVFERVVDATLAHHLREKFEPAKEALAELRAGMANDLRTGFRELSRSDAEPSEVQGRVAALCARVDESARTVKETLTAMARHQPGSQAPTATQDHSKPGTHARTRTTGVESQR
jgi:hypothetical protein